MLVAVFESETTAYEGLSALKNLHSNGDITLYATAVISKNEKGELNLETAADQGPIGTATGMLTGSLIGLLGGPVGVAIGVFTGSLAGLMYDISADDVNTTFVEEVSNALTKGKTALIAEIDESWTIPVDTRLEALNAVVFRRLKSEVAEDQLARESAAIAAELKTLKEEWKEAGEERKAAIQSAIAKLQGKAKTMDELVERKLNESKSQLEAKVNALQEQMKDARERRKTRIEKRIGEMKEDYRARTEKLKQASKLIKEAFDPEGEMEKPGKAHTH